MKLSEILADLLPAVLEGVQIAESPSTTQAQQADVYAKIETVLNGVSPVAARVVNAAIPLVVAISQHPNPGQLISAGLNTILSFTGSTFTF
jgi:hypothetical protein